MRDKKVIFEIDMWRAPRYDPDAITIAVNVIKDHHNNTYPPRHHGFQHLVVFKEEDIERGVKKLKEDIEKQYKNYTVIWQNTGRTL